MANARGTTVPGRRSSGWPFVLIAALVILGGWILVPALLAPGPDGARALPPESGVPEVAVSGVDPGPVPEPSSAGVTAAAARPGNAERVDPTWAAAVAARAGIPPRALLGYAGAELALARETPGCGIRWSTLAALGEIESSHGTHAGSRIAPDGETVPGIFGPRLDGDGTARIGDTDAGAVDGLADIDRAAGPLQFIPATWQTWGADGNGDGRADPQQIDDAALAAARYLCHYGDLTDAAAWRTAIFAYNHLDSYVDAVAEAANRYADLSRG